MRGRIGRLRLLIGALSVLMVIVGGILAALAKDASAAGIAALGVVASLLTFFGDPLRKAMFPSRRAPSDVRATLLAEARSEWEQLSRTLPPDEAWISLSAVRGGAPGGDTVRLDRPAEIFYLSGGRLAITGEPGSGKTTTALRLFGELIEEAGTTTVDTVPVFLRLATWNAAVPRLEDWLAEQIGSLFGLDPPEATAVVRRVVPFLDGLDEISEANRTECARSIEQYLQTQRAAPLVICCRTREFSELSLSRTDSSLLRITLGALAPGELRRFFTGLNATTWRPLTSELARDPDGPLARVLASPLMTSLIYDLWARGDPAELVRRTTGRGLDERQTREMLWERWFERRARGLTDAARAGALGAATGLTKAGTSEIRIHRLGWPATRWTWYLVKALLVAAAASVTAPALVVFAFAPNFTAPTVRATGRLPLRVARFLQGVLFVLAIGGPLALAVLFPDPAPAAAVALGLGSAALAAWPKEEIAPMAAVVRNVRGDAFRAMRRAGAAPVLVLAGIWLGCMALYSFLAGGLPPTELIALSTLIAVYGAGFAGLDFAGHHLLARSWHRVVRKVGLKSLMAALVDAGIVQQTSHSYRFFHMELQRHLSDAGPGRIVSFDNVGVDGFLEDARIAAQGHDYDLAASLLRRVTRALPNVDLSLNLGVYLSLSGTLDEALTEFERAQEREPANPVPAACRGEVLAQMGRTAEALEAYDLALRLDPDRVSVHISRADILWRLGRLEDALEASAPALRLDPGNSHAWAVRGELLVHANRLEEALETYDQALELDRHYASCHLARARILRALGRPDEAMAALDRVAEPLARSVVEAERGLTFQELGRPTEALECLDRALALDDDGLDTAAVHAVRAEVLTSLGRLDEALRALDSAEKPDADEIRLGVLRAELLVQLGRGEEALAVADAMTAAGPELVLPQVVRATVLAALDRSDDAIALLDRMGAADPGNTLIELGRVEVLRIAERFDDALRTLDELGPDVFGTAGFLLTRGQILDGLGRTDEAVAALEESLRLAPEVAETAAELHRITAGAPVHGQ